MKDIMILYRLGAFSKEDGHGCMIGDVFQSKGNNLVIKLYAHLDLKDIQSNELILFKPSDCIDKVISDIKYK